MRYKSLLLFIPFILLFPISSDSYAREETFVDTVDVDNIDLKDYPMVVWTGMEKPVMTFAELASYCAPVLWFSPDEPILEGTTGKEIMVPTSFPFEEKATTPVVYYRFRNIIIHKGMAEGAVIPDEENRNNTKIDLSHVAVIDLDFFFYYPFEEGFGSHPHDCESTQMKLAVLEYPQSKKYKYMVVVLRTVAKAHMNLWYDNTLESDKRTVFPIHIMVEEGKHGSCTDKNADGYFTPGYDVNKRVNDAWGVRDVMASGSLYSGGYQAWMTKTRRPEHRVFPPLPPDSPHYRKYIENGEYAPENSIYTLRPFPDTKKAEPSLKKVMKLYGEIEWPQIEKENDFAELVNWFEKENFVNSYSLALRMDGTLGASLIMPLFIFRDFEEPLSGGYIVNRFYTKNIDFTDFGYNLLYTPSASRWMDAYIAVGAEWNKVTTENGETRTRRQFVVESGVKFRFNIRFSKAKFLTKFGTDFYGVRFGIKNTGAWDIRSLGYVIEFGAGVW